jgi:hypothetical protein
MRSWALFLLTIFLVLIIQTGTQSLDYPEAPRVSPYEAFLKYSAGKAIILHGGGEIYNRRHIAGAINVDYKDREKLLLKFPKQKIEIFTYCY